MRKRWRDGLVGPLLGLLAAGVHTPALQAQVLTGPQAATLPVAGFEDYVVPIGHMEDGVLRVTLEVRPVQWRPHVAEIPVRVR